MGLSLLIIFIRFLLFLSSFYLMHASSFSSIRQPRCHDSESSALLQFKQSFLIDRGASLHPSAYPRVIAWKSHAEKGRSDCCYWDGVECDWETGHVIGLHLGSSCLSGSINSSSILFSLAHLRRLNLSDNDFHGSEIPNGIGQLSRLRSLDLSYSKFSGDIPLEIPSLSKLVFLDLSRNPMLQLRKLGLRNLAQNLTRLKKLHLSQVNISSTIPHELANLSSLTSLFLRECGLHGEFPLNIFELPNLQFLSVWYNPELTGYLPEFQNTSSLKLLYLGQTSFSGELPASIGRLVSLSELDISSCNFIGSVPTSLGHLHQLSGLDLSNNSFTGQISSFVANLTQLNFLSLYLNDFSAGGLAWLGQLPKLNTLDLSQLNLNGEIPPSLVNMSELTYLNLGHNQLTGQIPSWLGNLTQFSVLLLGNNNLEGGIPSSLFELVNLEALYLGRNYLNGTVELNMFSKLKYLGYLDLSNNRLTLLNYNNINVTLPKFKVLGLNACNVRNIPDFLQTQDELIALRLSINKIHGSIPKWMWNISRQSLEALELHQNFLTSFDPPGGVVPWSQMLILDIRYNMLQQSLPIPPPSINLYQVAGNKLFGQIPHWICNMSSLSVLDLSSNNLSGRIPQCFSNLSSSLSVLNLRDNNLHGSIPQTCTDTSSLRMVDLSENQLQGQVPRSLANCMMLEELVLGNNMIKDIFPFWLGALPRLQILILRSNLLHAAIGRPRKKFEFSKLRIIDLSYNEFTGDLPSENFKHWNAMKQGDASHFKYLENNRKFDFLQNIWTSNYSYTMKVTNKGIQRFYEKIPDTLTAIDFSFNNFTGHIPTSIGKLKGLHLLNLGGNNLTGHIPSSLGNLTRMESLDLSMNKLSGEIPWELTKMTFLEFFNVSHNQLTGPIPEGRQFATFSSSSFDGNPGLCGSPLSRACGSPGASSSTQGSTGSSSELDWKFVPMGYVSGLVLGVSIGYCLTSWKHEWFVKIFGRQQRKRLRKEKRGQRGHRVHR